MLEEIKKQLLRLHKNMLIRIEHERRQQEAASANSNSVHYYHSGAANATQSAADSISGIIANIDRMIQRDNQQ